MAEMKNRLTFSSCTTARQSTRMDTIVQEKPRLLTRKKTQQQLLAK
jgi:hypothetical protein